MVEITTEEQNKGGKKMKELRIASESFGTIWNTSAFKL